MPGEPSLTEAQVQAIVAGEVNRLRGYFGETTLPEGQRVRQALENKAKDAIREEGVLTEATIYNSPGLYNRLRETLYEVLRDNGVIDPPPQP
jgi:hypothetical protein